MPRARSTEEGPRTRIAGAARVLFLADGFDAVTTERLAREANVSKTSIYRHFGDMGGVLRAVAEAEADRFRLDAIPEYEDGREFRSAVIGFGVALLEKILEPDSLRFDRLVFESSRTRPEVAEIYFEAMILRTQRHLEALLRSGVEASLLPPDTRVGDLADHLLSVWQGTGAVRARLGLGDRPYDDLEAWCAQGVDALIPRS